MTESRYEIAIAIGPCTEDEMTALMEHIANDPRVQQLWGVVSAELLEDEEDE